MSKHVVDSRNKRLEWPHIVVKITVELLVTKVTKKRILHYLWGADNLHRVNLNLQRLS